MESNSAACKRETRSNIDKVVNFDMRLEAVPLALYLKAQSAESMKVALVRLDTCQ
jgi:hypothetical protein